MKSGRTIIELAKELQRRANAKSDFVAKTSAISMSIEEDAHAEFNRLLKLNVGDERFGINELTHNQLGSYCDIPAKYYDRCRSQDPDLLVHNVNTWVHKAQEKRMVRVLDGNARAFLSDRYRPLENEDLAEAILPIILNSGEYDLMSCEATERRLYLKVVG